MVLTDSFQFLIFILSVMWKGAVKGSSSQMHYFSINVEMIFCVSVKNSFSVLH